MPTRAGGQEWIVSWHPNTDQPSGMPHGAAGVCVTGTDHIVVISHDGEHWGFPAGRPEGSETPEETLHREVRGEACLTVVGARLLGFARSECLRGRQQGLVLVRSYWRAEVEIGAWEPAFEVHLRRLVPVARAREVVRDPDVSATRVSFRALDEARL